MPLLKASYLGGIMWLLARHPAWLAWLHYPGRMSLSIRRGALE